MIRLIASLFLLLAAADVATAQTLIVRTGEHGEFTRIVANLPDDMSPRVIPTAYGLEIQFPTEPDEIDVTNTFARIDRERIANISIQSDQRTIRVEFACECGFRTFTQDREFLVIDVGETFPFELTADVSDRIMTGIRRSEPLQTSQILPLFFISQQDDPELSQFFDNRTEASLSAPTSAAIFRENLQERSNQSDMDSRVEGVDVSLLNAIKLATRRGILNVDQVGNADAKKPDVIHRLKRVENIQTHMDEGQNPDGRAIDRSAGEDTNCLAESDLNIGEWSASQNFSDGLALWNRSLVQDLDKLDSASVLALARHYIYFGFGVEAMAALSLVPDLKQASPVISSLSQILDQGWDAENTTFQGMLQCEGPASLWSAMSLEFLPKASGINTRAVRLAFEALPRNLKENIGPQLAARLSKAGETVAADAILASISSNNSEISPYIELSKAKLSLDLSNQPEAQIRLEQVSRLNSELAPIALIDLIKSKINQSHSVERELIEVLESYIFEYRGTDIEKDLNYTHIIALAYSDQFQTAIDYLIETKDTISHQGRLEAMSQVIERLVSHASDVDFLAIAAQAGLPDMSIQARSVLVERLLSLGFKDLAQRDDLLSGESTIEVNQEFSHDLANSASRYPVNEQVELPLQNEGNTFSRDRRGDLGLTAAENKTLESFHSRAFEDEQRFLPVINQSDGSRELGVANVSELAELMFGQTEPSEGLDSDENKRRQLVTLGQAKDLITESNSTRQKLKEFLDNFQIVQ